MTAKNEDGIVRDEKLSNERKCCICCDMRPLCNLITLLWTFQSKRNATDESVRRNMLDLIVWVWMDTKQAYWHEMINKPFITDDMDTELDRLRKYLQFI